MSRPAITTNSIQREGSRGGTCKLTLTVGRFVKSHIIPRAFTKPSKKGSPLTQMGSGEMPTQRWDSWYDGELVTQTGEDILARIDGWAVNALRQAKLVWSGWEGDPDNLSGYRPFSRTPWGSRRVEGVDSNKFRLFCLSLLWRAAASQRWEFSEITLPDADIETLRQSLVTNVLPPRSFYPTQVTQIITRGEQHNQTPINTQKIVPNFEERGSDTVDVIRFYFDGLVLHQHRTVHSNDYIEALGDLFVGHNKTLTCSTVTYEESWQRENLQTVKQEALHAHVMRRQI